MPAKKTRPAAPTPSVGKLKPLRLRSVASQDARRPIVPTHATNLASHARQHVPRSAQS